MRFRHIAIAAAVVLAVGVADSQSAMQEASNAGSAAIMNVQKKVPPGRMRFINTVAGMVPVELRINYHTLCARVKYGQASPFRTVGVTGECLMDVVTPGGRTTIIPVTTFPGVEPAMDYTVVASGADGGEPPIETFIMDWPYESLARRQAQYVFANAVTDIPSVDLYIDGNLVSSGVPYQGWDPPMLIGTGKHTIEVWAGAEPLVAPQTIKFTDKNKYTLVLVGTMDDEDAFPVALKVFVSP